MKRILTYFPRWIAILTLAVFLGAVASPASAQDHEDEDGEDLQGFIEGLSMDAASKYVAPIVSAFGTSLNGGWFHKAPSATIGGFNVELGLVGMATFYPKDQKYLSFETSGDFQFNSEQAGELVEDLFLPVIVEDALIDALAGAEFTVGISGATVIGAVDDYIEISFSGADITFIDPTTGLERTETVGAQVITLPIGGFKAISDLSFLPLAAPQLSLGTVFGTRVTFRYLPSITLDEELGKFKFFGFGIQHNPGVFLPTPLPFDVGLGFFTQTIEVGTLFKAKTTAYGLNVSKKLGVGAINITPYAGFMLEKSNIDITYDFIVDNEEINVAFELEGENKSRLTFGLSLRLLMLNFNADYNIGKYNSVTVGVMFTI